jgi:hypothetical protein
MPRHRPVSSRVAEFEALEDRTVPAITFLVDYTYDTQGFFTNATRRQVLEAAAAAVATRLNDSLAAITPSGGNNWTRSFFHPGTGSIQEITNGSIAADTIIIYAGGRELGSTLGQGGFGGWGGSGSQAWLDTLSARGQAGALGNQQSQTDFGPWGGSLTFDTTTSWYFSTNAAGLPSNQFDFYSVAMHEIGHLIGFGTANSFDNRVSGGVFTGPVSVGLYGGNIPISGDLSHWQEGVTYLGQETSMDPSIMAGTRKLLNDLDWAGLDDLGWDVGSNNATPPTADIIDVSPDPRVNGVSSIVVNFNETVTGVTIGDFRLTRNGSNVTLTGATVNQLSGSSYRVNLGTLADSVGAYQFRLVASASGITNGAGVALAADATDSWNRVTARQAVLGRADGNWWSARSTGSSFNTTLFASWSNAVAWTSVATGDVNGDGQSDVIGRDSGSGVWWVSTSTGTSANTSSFATWNPNATFVDTGVGDFNGDGRTDIIGRVQNSGEWYLGTSTGTSFTTSLLGTWNPSVNWIDVRIGDVTGDGRADVLGRDAASGIWWVLRGTGGASLNFGAFAPSITWLDMRIGDIDNNGRADVIGRSQTDGSWWAGLSNGSSFTLRQMTVWSPAANWTDVGLADVDGNGSADIIGRVGSTGAWWAGLFNGTTYNTTFLGSWAPTVDWRDVRFADFTGDGRADIVGRDPSTGVLWVAVSGGTSINSQAWGTWSTAVTWVDVRTAILPEGGSGSALPGGGRSAVQVILPPSMLAGSGIGVRPLTLASERAQSADRPMMANDLASIGPVNDSLDDTILTGFADPHAGLCQCQRCLAALTGG